MKTINARIAITPELLAALADEIEQGNRGQMKSPWSVNELADKMGVTPETIYNQIKAGRIRKIEGIGKVLIPFKEVERLLS